MEFSKEELEFLHCFIGGCDYYLLQHIMSLNKDYEKDKKEELAENISKIYSKIDRFLKRG